MPKFAANLSMMFNEVPFPARFAAAAAAGFKGVEFLFPYELPAREVARLLTDALEDLVVPPPCRFTQSHVAELRNSRQHSPEVIVHVL